MNKGMGSAIEHGVCLLLIIGGAALILHPAIVSGGLPIATDQILFQAPWEEACPEGIAVSADPLAREQAARFYPWYAFISDSSSRDDSLLWNPLENGGFPFLAVWRTRVFSPFTAPFYFFPVQRALQLSVFLKFLVTGLCAFYVARRLGYRPPFALGAALAFQACGHMMLWTGWPISDVVPWVPLLVLFVEHLALRRVRYWPFGATVAALMLLGGDPETVAGAFFFVAVYFCVRCFAERSGFRAAFVGMLTLAASMGVALCLTAVQVLPYAEFVSLAATRGVSDPGSGLRVGHLVLSFLPHFLGQPPSVTLEGGVPRDFRVVGLLHVGLVQILLLPLWFALRRHVDPLQRQRVESLLAAAGVCFFVALFAGNGLARIPYLNLLGPEHLLAANAFALALLAFSAAEEWLELDPDQCHEAVRRFFFMLPALLGAALILWAIHLSGERPHAPRFPQQIVWFGIVCAITLGLLGFTIFKPWGRFLGYSLACVGFCELYAAFHGALVFTPRDRVFPETPFIRALKSAGVRVGGSGALMGWPLAGNLVPQAYGASGVTLKRHAQFVQQLSEKPLLVRRMGAPALLLTKQDVLGPFASVRPLLQVKHVFSSGTLLFDDLGARPRAWMAYEGRDSNRFDPALLSPTDPPLIELSAPPTSGAGPEAQAQIDPSSTNTEVLVRVTDTRPGVLVLTDAWYPGWQVTVDGVKTAVLPVDGAFRGVSLEKGPHEILFSYVPQSYRLGKQISAAACLLVALGMLHFSVLDIRDRRLLRVQWSDES